MPKEIRPIRVVGDVAFITIEQGYEAIIDAADVPLIDGFKWKLHENPAGNIYVRCGRHPKRIWMHRLILNCPDHMQTDHIDGNGLNNRRSNLREATSAHNNRNRRISTVNSSGFKGVSFHKMSSKWQSCIFVDGRSKHLGLFDTPEEAHAAYCAASAKYHGEFGRTE